MKHLATPVDATAIENTIVKWPTTRLIVSSSGFSFRAERLVERLDISIATTAVLLDLAAQHGPVEARRRLGMEHA